MEHEMQRLLELAGIDGARDVQTNPATADHNKLSKTKKTDDDGQRDYNPDVQGHTDVNSNEGESAISVLKSGIDQMRTFLMTKQDETQRYTQLNILLDQVLNELKSIDFSPPLISAPPLAGGGKNQDASIGSHIG